MSQATQKTDKLYSVEDAAQYLGGLSKYTIHAWLSQGKLARTKVGSRTMIRESDLQAYVDACNPESAAARMQPRLDRFIREGSKASGVNKASL
jgi:excisionase family DNA binding protein